jgi:hypothetical protein
MNDKIFLIFTIFLASVSISSAQEKNKVCKGTIIYPTDDINICNSNPWVVVFEDEFNSLDSKRWNQWSSSYLCDEVQQFYSFGDNTTIDNGILTITGKEVEPFMALIDPEKEPTDYIECKNGSQYLNWHEFKYTSDKIFTREQFSYAKFEARIRFSDGSGMWPAFWLWQAGGPNEEAYREIDIVEIYKNEFSKYKMNVQYNYNNEGREQCPFHINLDNLCNSWHVLGLSYERDFIIWYIDYQEVGRVRHYWTELGQEIGCELNGWTPYLMNTIYPNGEPMELVINLAIYEEGNYKPYENFHETVEVDWVKVYYRSNPNDVLVSNESEYPLVHNLYNAIMGQNITFDCNYEIPTNEFLRVQANNSIRPLPGFHAVEDSELQLVIDNITKSSNVINSKVANDYVESFKIKNDLEIWQKSIDISPNPSNGMFNLTSNFIEKSIITVINCSGVIVYKTEEIPTNSIMLDLTFLQSGVYFVQITNKGSQFTDNKKIIIL